MTIMTAAPTNAEGVRATPPAIEGWDTFVDGLRDLAPKVLGKLPPEMQADPQVRQEVGRLIIESLASNALMAISADPDHPIFLPNINYAFNIGQPNADTTYRSARITPGGTYRLRGRRGTLRLAKVGQLGPVEMSSRTPGSATMVKTYGYNDLASLHVDADDRFDVLLSPTKPKDYTGDWWHLSPNATTLMVRMVSSDWAKERDPTLSIERLDIPASLPRRDAADLSRRLAALLPATAGFAGMFVDHIVALEREGYVNKLKIFDVSQMGALEGQFYYEGAYDLTEDEALIVESKMPKKCGYASTILTNAIYETTNWFDNHSSLNDSQFKVDSDGILRIVVSARDPGVPNWLDTAGYPKGVIQGRWTDCDSEPVPVVRKVAIKDLRASLPADTPTVTLDQREQIIRDRRAAMLQRPIW